VAEKRKTKLHVGDREDALQKCERRRMAARRVAAVVRRERTCGAVRGVGRRWHGSGPCLAAQSRVTSPQQLAARAYLVHLRGRAPATIMYTISIFCYVEVCLFSLLGMKK
jgi:hypothetical protein